MNIPSYIECSDCGQIIEGKAWTGLRTKCKFCHKSIEQRIWPSPEVMNILVFINSHDVKSPQYPQIACVFLSSALELMLEELLYVMTFEDLLYEDAFVLADALFDGYQGRSRMFTLYSKIACGTFHGAVKKIGVSRFLKDWDILVDARNKVVHGNINKCEKITQDLIERTINDALIVFSNLHNQYNTESIKYKSALKYKD